MATDARERRSTVIVTVLFCIVIAASVCAYAFGGWGLCILAFLLLGGIELLWFLLTTRHQRAAAELSEAADNANLDEASEGNPTIR